MADTFLNLNELPIEKKTLDIPSLEDLVTAFKLKLCKNFAEVRVEVVECPDLTQKPFNLAAKGLNGNVSILDIGGPPFLLPLVQRDKCYDLRTLPKLVGDEKSFIIGAGAGPWPYVGTNCELILNEIVDKTKVLVPASKIAIVENKSVKLLTKQENEPRCCLLANIYSCRGEPGKVIKVHCKKRTGKLDFTTSLREAVADKFPDKVIGMGGVFVILQGKVKQHVMPDFSKVPLNSDEELNKWLTFHEMATPLTAVGTFLSKDPGLDLRVQHFHSFGQTEGGHYHYDTTPENVEYLAYLSCGNILYRVDKPTKTTLFGFD